MATLNIKLNQEYKSFPNGFEVSLEGDLIVISGVNGSGKSQLMEIIKGYSRNNPDRIISVEKSLNGVHLKNGEVLYKSLTNSLGGGNIGTANPQNFNNYKDQIWNYYQNYNLDENNPNLRDYQKSCKEAKKKMIDKFGLEKFNSKQITRLDLNNPIFSDFIWQLDDIFSNNISDIFYRYANKKNDLIVKKSKIRILADDIDYEAELGNPPWEELNELFELLGIDYRFKDDYQSQDANIEQPKLHPLLSDGAIADEYSRDVSDLSDGEKVIISLIFSSLSGINGDDIKLLLLDEFDATFNPSLTEMFYRVIDKYFVSQGIMVIIVTHSPVTISLAPESTIFLEVRKRNSISDERIVKVEENDYAELRIAHQKFYTKISEQEEQINTLQSHIRQSTKNLIITEGKTDWRHIKTALKKFQENGEFLDLNDIDFLEYEDEMGDDLLYSYCKAESKKSHAKKIICIFDRDNTGYINKVDNKDWGNNLYSFCIPSPNHRIFDHVCIEHYYSDQDLQRIKDGRRIFLGTEFHATGNSIDGQYQTSQKNKCNLNKVIDDNVFLSSDLSHDRNLALSKDDFSRLTETFDMVSFENFRPLFEKIKSICNPTENSSS